MQAFTVVMPVEATRHEEGEMTPAHAVDCMRGKDPNLGNPKLL